MAMNANALIWRAHAACAGTSPAMFFDPNPQAIAAAKAICARCTVRDDCLAYALEADERFGVWGFLDETERAQLRQPGRRGPVPVLNDDALASLFTATKPDRPALAIIDDACDVGRQTAYKYIRRARELGLVERRGRNLYPRR
jgi:WhiB family transcriptional regulator, redox-sensing transcriptional regulator